MSPLLVTLPGAEHLQDTFLKELSCKAATLNIRKFPDGETYLRFQSTLSGQKVIILADLSRPDSKVCQLIFAARTARDLEANSIGLAAPYLPYMRQDKRFQSGEGVTSIYFAELISTVFDWIATVHPHLHRWKTLDEIYSIPAVAVPAATEVANWIDRNIHKPVLIGPDSESRR